MTAAGPSRWMRFLAVQRAQMVESPQDLQVGSVTHPVEVARSTGTGERCGCGIRPLAMGSLPRVSIAELDRDPSLVSRFAGKVVFVGETALAAGDSWSTPYSNGNTTPGIEMHASEYETLAQRKFLVDAPFLGCGGLLLSAGGRLRRCLRAGFGMDREPAKRRWLVAGFAGRAGAGVPQFGGVGPGCRGPSPRFSPWR